MEICEYKMKTNPSTASVKCFTRNRFAGMILK